MICVILVLIVKCSDKDWHKNCIFRVVDHFAERREGEVVYMDDDGSSIDLDDEEECQSIDVEEDIDDSEEDDSINSDLDEEEEDIKVIES